MTMKASAGIYNQAMPYTAMVLMRFGSAGLPIVAKYALNKGMSQHVLVVYRFAIATLVLAPFAIVFDRSVSLFISSYNLLNEFGICPESL